MLFQLEMDSFLIRMNRHANNQNREKSQDKADIIDFGLVIRWKAHVGIVGKLTYVHRLLYSDSIDSKQIT